MLFSHAAFAPSNALTVEEAGSPARLAAISAFLLDKDMEEVCRSVGPDAVRWWRRLQAVILLSPKLARKAPGLSLAEIKSLTASETAPLNHWWFRFGHTVDLIRAFRTLSGRDRAREIPTDASQGEVIDSMRRSIQLLAYHNKAQLDLGYAVARMRTIGLLRGPLWLAELSPAIESLSPDPSTSPSALHSIAVARLASLPPENSDPRPTTLEDIAASPLVERVTARLMHSWDSATLPQVTPAVLYELRKSLLLDPDREWRDIGLALVADSAGTPRRGR